jgi:LysM repeat protein
MLTGYFRQCPANHYPYTVQAGETLSSIAMRLEVSLARIMAANPGVNPYYLQIGQVLCIPACPPHHTPKMIEPGDTLYHIAQTYGVTVASILEANPGVDPNYLRVGQRLCIPAATVPGHVDCQAVIAAMQSDIDMLKAESSAQQTEQANYGTSTQTTRALKVTGSELQFDAAPVVFAGNFVGHYTAGSSYPYYADAASGGQRGITVKDNFGVWHSFGYHVPIA